MTLDKPSPENYETFEAYIVAIGHYLFLIDLREIAEHFGDNFK